MRYYYLGISERSYSRGYWGRGGSVLGGPHRVPIGYRSTPTQSPGRAFGGSQWGLNRNQEGRASLYSRPVPAFLPRRLAVESLGGPHAGDSGEAQGVHSNLCWK